MVRLRDLGAWAGGNTPSKTNDAYWTNGTVPWVSPKDMKVDEITSSEDLITEAALREGRVSMVPEGSVLFVTRSGILAHTLPVAVTSLPVTINQDLKALTPRTGVLPKYVAHAVRGASRRILKECSKHGTTVASIETNALLDFEIPMVDPDKQLCVIDEIEKQFSRLDEAVINLKRVKANLKRYKAAVLNAAVEGRLVPTEADIARCKSRAYETGAQLLQQVLEVRRCQGNGKSKYKEPPPLNKRDLPKLPDGWCWAALNQLAHRITDGTHRTPKYISHGVPFISVKDIRGGRIHFDDSRYISQTEHAELIKRCNPEPGDVLITKSGTIGRTAVIAVDRPFSLFVSVALIKPVKPYVNARFLQIVIDAYIQSIDISQDVKGGLLKNLHLEDLRLIPIPFPPHAEQARIVTEVDRSLSFGNALELFLTLQGTRCERLRSAILAAHFVQPRPCPLRELDRCS
jgi:type I restriction enzyme, S subunit